MRGDDLADNRQSEAGAFAAGIEAAVEPLEHPLPVPLRDAGPAVLDAEDDHVGLARETCRHQAAGRSVAQGIVDEIDDEFAQQRRVAPEQDLLRSGLETEV